MLELFRSLRAFCLMKNIPQLTHWLVWSFIFLDWQVLNPFLDRDPGLDVIRSNGNKIHFRSIYVHMVRFNASSTQYRRNDDHAQISQLHGSWFFHGRSCGYGSTLLFSCFNVSSMLRSIHGAAYPAAILLIDRSHSFFSFSPPLIYDRYIGYAKDQGAKNLSSKQEHLMSLFCFIESILLGSFAAILGAHRSEILDKPVRDGVDQVASNEGSETYEPPTPVSQH
jgi:hypothetical protein